MSSVAISLMGRIQQDLRGFNPAESSYATAFVDRMLSGALEIQASDLHLTPDSGQLDIRCRIDGVLQEIGCFPSGQSADIVARLKVLAELLTYHTEVPQEGRIRESPLGVEMRVSTFPTLHGERAVVRFFASQQSFDHFEDLGLAEETTDTLRSAMGETSGAVVISGPAGSGKTTTAYACLRELVRQSTGGRSIVSLEDPIEVAVPGVAQSQINAAAGFDLASGLRSIMRQDPEVILVGEIRDSATAEAALQASLTGHLVVTTFHAGTCGETLSRLVDMGIEPYLLRSGVLAVLNQRLLRRLCECSIAAAESAGDNETLGLPITSGRRAAGCEACSNTGYRGRLPIAEFITLRSGQMREAIFEGVDAAQFQQCAIDSGMKSNWRQACEAIDAGQTSAAEARRVLGFGEVR